MSHIIVDEVILFLELRFFMKVVVIDSGYSGIPKNCSSINGISIYENQGCFSFADDYTDKIGHGTAVVNILLENINRDVDLFIIKIF